MKISYEVRFTLYQYNSGKANNGYYHFSEPFSSLEEARIFLSHIENIFKSDTNEKNDFIHNYIYDGYIKSVDGIWKITEEKVEV